MNKGRRGWVGCISSRQFDCSSQIHIDILEAWKLKDTFQAVGCVFRKDNSAIGFAVLKGLGDRDSVIRAVFGYDACVGRSSGGKMSSKRE